MSNDEEITNLRYTVSLLTQSLQQVQKECERLRQLEEDGISEMTDSVIDQLALMLKCRNGEPLNYQTVVHAVDELLAERDAAVAALKAKS